MGQIKQRLRNCSLRTSFVLYMLVFLLIATFLCAMLMGAIDNVKMDIYYRYLQGPDGAIDWEALETEGYVFPQYSPEDRSLDIFLGIVGTLTVPVVFLGCTILASVLFYRNKLKKPFALLTDASAKIADNDLNFTIAYDSANELGRLCRSFETMRRSLEQNNKNLWRMLEERKRLNAAFSHDLRTPLTVLRGYADLLQKRIPQDDYTKERLLSTVSTMSGQIGRLEQYVESMSLLQSLEEQPLQPERLDAAALCASLRDTAAMLCAKAGRTLAFRCLTEGDVWLDETAARRILGNLVSNAVRFARDRVTLTCGRTDDRLWLRVEDDGPGLTAADLLEATAPYYRGQAGGGEGNHFGLGLNICKTLCERHGGALVLENGAAGGARITALLRVCPPPREPGGTR